MRFLSSKFVRDLIGSPLSRLEAPPLPPPDHLHKVQREQNILVTGATSGIGFELLRSLVAQGHTVVTHYHSEEGRLRLQRYYPEALSTHLDLTRFAGGTDGVLPLAAFREWVETRVGKLDAIVLNAGVTGLDWRSGYQRWTGANRWLASNCAMLDLFIDLLHDYDRKNRLCGRIAFVSSELANRPLPTLEAYHRIKKETEAEIDAMFGYGRPQPELLDILPFIIRPGSVATRMHEEVLAKAGPEAQQRTREKIAAGTLRSPAQVGRIIADMLTTGCVGGRAIGRLERVAISDRMYESEASAL